MFSQASREFSLRDFSRGSTCSDIISLMNHARPDDGESEAVKLFAEGGPPIQSIVVGGVEPPTMTEGRERGGCGTQMTGR